MATPDFSEYQLPVFWDTEYKQLDYVNEPFNDPDTVARWTEQGYQSKICGELCDMRHQLPSWNQQFIDYYTGLGWKNIGVAYYRMKTGTVMPVHSDLYRRYVQVFDLQGQEHTIQRALVLLEDWRPGHYLEVQGQPIVNWSAGHVAQWTYDAPHMAANIGLEDRYTLQITGHL